MEGSAADTEVSTDGRISSGYGGQRRWKDQQRCGVTLPSAGVLVEAIRCPPAPEW